MYIDYAAGAFESPNLASRLAPSRPEAQVALWLVSIANHLCP